MSKSRLGIEGGKWYIVDVTILCTKAEREIGEEHRQAILELLSGRPLRVRILALSFHDFDVTNDRKFSEVLVRLMASGTTLTIIVGELPQKMEKETKKFLQKITEYGARVYFKRNVHAKLLLAEESQRAHALVTSANFTKTGLRLNYEAGSYYRDMDTDLHMVLLEFTNHVLGLESTRDILHFLNDNPF